MTTKAIYQLKIFSNYAAINKQIIKIATRIAKDSSTLIDVILTNRPDNVINANSIISSLSDHNVIKCVRKLHNIKFNPRTIKCRDYKNYDQTTVSAELSVVNWDIVYNTPDPDMAWNNLQQILSETINRHAPLINKRVNRKPAPGLTLMSKLRWVTEINFIENFQSLNRTLTTTLYGVHKKRITSLS